VAAFKTKLINPAIFCEGSVDGKLIIQESIALPKVFSSCPLSPQRGERVRVRRA
jgi:hypothetical protein